VATDYREISASVEKLTGANPLGAGIEPGVPQAPVTIGSAAARARRAERSPLRQVLLRHTG
jgi:hypothetical protein